MLVPLMDPTLQAHFIIKRLCGLLDEGRNPHEIAILYRAHYQSMELQMELSRRNMPFIITSGVRFFEQAHIRDIAAHLRFASNPEDSTAFVRLLALLPRIGPRGAQNLLKKARELAVKNNQPLVKCLRDETVLKKIPKQASEDYIDLALTLENIVDAIGTTGLVTSGEQTDLFNKPEVPVALPQSPADVVRIAIEGWYGGYVRELFPKNWQSRKDDLESLIGFADRYETMENFLTELVLLNSETTNRSIDSDQDCIRLSTIHQAKGLEFPVVFIIGLAQGYFPLNRAIEEGNIEEERRLLYVATTRAMDELYLTFPQIAIQSGSPTQVEPSQFIQEISPEHYEVLHMGQ